MTFDSFGLSRDMLYLSCVFAGIVVGLLLTLLRKKTEKRSRNRRIALILLFLSLAIGTIAISASVSMGAVFRETGMLILGGIFALVCALAVCFPRAVAYPVILLAGFVTVCLACLCLRFPSASTDPLAVISPVAGDFFSVNVFPAARHDNPEKNSAGRKNASRVFFTRPGAARVSFSFGLVEIDRVFPLVGGSGHVILRAIESDAGALFSGDPLAAPLPGAFFRSIDSSRRPSTLGLSFQNLSGAFSLEEVIAKAGVAVSISELTAERN